MAASTLLRSVVILLGLLCGTVGCSSPESEAAGVDSAAGDSPPTIAPSEPEPPALDLESIVARLHHGIDVSTHSGTVDWTAVAEAGHGFAFAKATEGVDLADPSFATNWEGMKAAGLVRGAYHFYVTEDDPDQQADFFIRNVKLEAGDLAPVIDIELIGHDTPPGLAARLRRFSERLEAYYGIRPIIYTAPNFWNTHFEGGFSDHPLWIAEYDVDQPKIPAGWETWHLWQWQGDAELPGVEDGADRSRINRDVADLAALIVVP